MHIYIRTSHIYLRTFTVLIYIRILGKMRERKNDPYMFFKKAQEFSLMKLKTIIHFYHTNLNCNLDVETNDELRSYTIVEGCSTFKVLFSTL